MPEEESAPVRYGTGNGADLTPEEEYATLRCDQNLGLVSRSESA
jgi:hypothetical protein